MTTSRYLADYVSLDAVVDPETALNAEVLLFDDTAEGNVVCRMEAEGLVADFESCEVVTEVRTVNNRLAPAPIETRVAAARWGDDGRLHCYNAGRGHTRFVQSSLPFSKSIRSNYELFLAT